MKSFILTLSFLLGMACVQARSNRVFTIGIEYPDQNQKGLTHRLFDIDIILQTNKRGHILSGHAHAKELDQKLKINVNKLSKKNGKATISLKGIKIVTLHNKGFNLKRGGKLRVEIYKKRVVKGKKFSFLTKFQFSKNIGYVANTKKGEVRRVRTILNKDIRGMTKFQLLRSLPRVDNIEIKY